MTPKPSIGQIEIYNYPGKRFLGMPTVGRLEIHSPKAFILDADRRTFGDPL